MARVWALLAALMLAALIGCAGEIVEPTPDRPTLPPTVPSPDE